MSYSAFDIRNFGAVGDGTADNTKAIQDAIDACHESGGGVVTVSGGRYLFYPVRLKSNVYLEVCADAVLLAGTDPALYPEVPENPYWNVLFALRHNRRYVFYAEGAENIGIIGKGKIDFQGMAFIDYDPSVQKGYGRWKRYSDTEVPGRCIFFVSCRGVRLEDVTLVDSPGAWFSWLLDCEEVRVHGVTMMADVRMPNSDGLHLGSCRNVIVSDCRFEGGDDAIVLRSMQEQFSSPRACENVTIENCIMHLGRFSSAVLLGWSHDYAIRNCVVNNLVVSGASQIVCSWAPTVEFSDSKDPPRYPDTPEIPPISPLQIENIQFNNITATDVGTILHIKLDDSMPVDYVRNIAIRNVQASCAQYPCIECSAHHHVSDIELSNINLRISEQTGPDVSEWMSGYHMVFNHVSNVVLNNFRFQRIDHQD